MSMDEPDIVIYSSPFCGYCAAARRLLRAKHAYFEEIDVLLDGNKHAEMVARSGRTTVPQVFVGGEHIGGFDDLRALDEAGELDGLIGRQATET
jgi:glutaredoxin 3